MWIDAHCHPDGLADPDAALAEAEAAGIGHWILPGTEPQQWRNAGQRFESDPRIHLAVGHHPWFLPVTEPDVSELESELDRRPHWVALGEIGLDFHIASNAAERQHQEDWFTAQLAVAAERQLPVIVHSVKAHDRVLSLLKRFPQVRGVIHAFLGPYEQALAFIDKGWCLGCGSLILKSPKTRDAFARLPADAILLETDAPDMRPHPALYANPLLDLLQTAEQLAQSRGVSLDQLKAQTATNVRRLFQKF
ncbi:TatD family hydrolase [Saccharospirillum mangrovi]|uniref:TatD family hydrolase n=1 Tax=Saccharospirillum mangrovi TaxID=2161747 RepID=UPI000D3BFD54|nr:TatD family hydrolase [Saccharospirillum mangrovi]